MKKEKRDMEMKYLIYHLSSYHHCGRRGVRSYYHSPPYSLLGRSMIIKLPKKREKVRKEREKKRNKSQKT